MGAAVKELFFRDSRSYKVYLADKSSIPETKAKLYVYLAIYISTKLKETIYICKVSNSN